MSEDEYGEFLWSDAGAAFAAFSELQESLAERLVAWTADLDKQGERIREAGETPWASIDQALAPTHLELAASIDELGVLWRYEWRRYCSATAQYYSLVSMSSPAEPARAQHELAVMADIRRLDNTSTASLAQVLERLETIINHPLYPAQRASALELKISVQHLLDQVAARVDDLSFLEQVVVEKLNEG